MHWTRWSAVSLIASSLILSLVALSCTSQPVAKTEPTREEMVERGRHLVTTSGCIDCHTPGTLFGAPDFERQLSGSELGWKGPWGVSYPRNLTPDEETGIGSWSEEEMVIAFRTGNAPGGRALLPPMPWQAYAEFTDEEAFAIAAYLKSLPPINHRVPDRLPPGVQPAGSFIVMPAPSAWDAPRTPPDQPEGDAEGEAH